MKTILAKAWNAMIDRLRRDQLLGATVLERGGWKHPWQVTPSWDPENERWVAEIHPGFVNGIDTEIRIREDEAPADTLERLGIDPKNAAGGRVDAWLTELPLQPLTQWRSIGRDASPSSVSVSGFENIVASYEKVPDFFLALGAGEPPEGFFAPVGTKGGTRLLRATEIVLHKDRITTGTDWTFGAGVDGTFAQFDVIYRLPPGAREHAYIRTTAKYEPPQRPDALERLRGNWEDVSYDPLHLSTVYLLSPEDTPAGSEPGPEWTPYVKHRVFWNLNHAISFEPPRDRRDNITMFTGLAGGVADGLINQMLADINDRNAALSEFLGNRTIEGRYWTI